jgi:hypothetical protein
MKRALAFCCAGLLLCQTGCKKHATEPKPAISEPGLHDDFSVNFDIALVPVANGSRAWLATYSSQGKVARFRIELDMPKETDSKSVPGIDIGLGKGAIKAESGSDASVMLLDLKKALDAKNLPTKTKRADSLPFSYVILGENNSLAPGGGLSATPAGEWTAMKIFLHANNDEAEVFLNFNPVEGKAQFSQKDPDYGDVVLAQLATVL